MRNIWITIKKELRTTIRDKKSLQMMIVGPLLIPICMLLFSFSYENMFLNMQAETYNIGINYELNSEEEKLMDDNYLVPTYYETVEELQLAYESGNIDAYIVRNETEYTIYSNPSKTTSSNGGFYSQTYLEEYRDVLARKYLESININLEEIDNNITIVNEDLVGDSSMATFVLDLGVTFGIMAILLVAIYCVTDSIAGEKEHGTLETLLTFPIKNNELILGKYFSVSVSCIVTSLICLVLIIVSSFLAESLFTICDGITLYITPLTIVSSLIIMISFSLFASALCIAVASFSRSYKEAQSTLTPVSYIAMLPMFFQMFDINLNMAMSALPCVSHMMLMTNLFCMGVTSDAIMQLLISTVTTIIYTVVLVHVITKLYNGEKVLFSN